MNKVKKVMAIILSFALVFGSVSALSSAVFNDGNMNTTMFTQKFFRLDDKGDADPSNDEWVETTKVAPGEHIKVRMYLKTDYYLGGATLTYFFSKHSLIPCFEELLEEHSNGQYVQTRVDEDPDDVPAFADGRDGAWTTPFNNDPDSQSGSYGRNPITTLYRQQYREGGIIESVDFMVQDGVIEDTFLDRYGFLFLGSGAGMKPGVTCQLIDGNDWWYEYDFRVASTADADDEIKVFMVPGGTSMLTPNDSGYCESAVNVYKAEEPNVPIGLAIPAYEQWDGDYYYVDAVATTGSKITFDPGVGGTVIGTAGNTGVIGTTLATLPTASSAAGSFIGWVPSTVANPTAADVISGPLTYGYEDVTYNALYAASSTVNVTFDANGGTFGTWGASPYTYSGVTPGDAMTVDTVTKTDNKFLGWTTVLDDAGTLVSPMPSVYPSATTTYYALWSDKASYTTTTYVAGVDNTYGTASPVTASGTIGTTVSIPVDAGFSLDPDYTATDIPSGTIAADDSLALTAHLKRNTYNVNYVLTRPGEVADAPIAVPYIFGADVTPRANAAEIPGYTFTGWVGEPETMPIGDVTVTGTYTANDVAVNYSYTGTVPADATALPANVTDAHIGDVINLTAPTAAGYNFSGWTVTGAASQTATSFTVGSTTPITVTGSWTPVDYTVDYSYTGTVPADATALPDDITNAHIGDVINLNTPTAQGYTFSGWTVTGAASQTATSFTVGTDDITVVGSWTADDVAITYSYAAGAPANAPALPANVTNAHIGDVVNLTAPELEGYNFSWAVTGAASQTATSFTVGTDDITVVGTWTAKNYDITYKLTNIDSTVTETTVTYAYGAPVTPAAPPVAIPDGYTFAGWVGEPTTMPANNVDVTGEFDPILRTITYSYATTPNGASALPATINDAIIGDTVDISAIPTAPGYAFDKWTVSGAVGEQAPYTVGTSDVTVVGSWTAIPYSVTYEFDGIVPAGVTAPEDETIYNIGDTVTYLDPIIAVGFEGYHFSGWTATNAASSTETSCVVGANNILLTGSWIANEHTVTFDPDGGYFDGDETATEPAVLDVSYGGEITAPADPEKAGSTFMGWSLNGVDIVDVAATLEVDDDVIYTAIWEKIEYTVYYSYIDELDNICDLDEAVFNYGDEITAADVPDVAALTTGYKAVDGTWYYDEMLAEPVTFPITVGEDDIFLYIVCELDEYDARFNAVDADGIHTTAVFEGNLAYVDVPTVFGEAIEAPADPIAPAGFYFNGWSPAVGVMDEEGKTYNATYAPYYTITYSYAGDIPEGVTAPAAITNAKPGDAVSLPATVTGYNLTWAVTGANETEAPYTVGTANVTAVGTWEAIDYAVTYSYTNAPAYGTAPALPNATTANIGDDMTVAAVPTLEGYDFSGWTTTDATVVGNAYEMPANAVEFTGTWTAKDYTITYSYNLTPAGAAALPENVTDANIGDVVALTTPANVAGYNFGGWTVTGELDDAATQTGFTVGSENITVVGTWIPSGNTPYTIITRTMDTTGLAYAETTATAYGTTGATIVVEPASVPEGFTFNAADSTAENSTTINANGLSEVVVVLDRNQYAVAFEGFTPVNMYYQAVITEHTAPTAPTGHSFVGWVSAGTVDPTEDSVVDFAAVTVPIDGVSYDAFFTPNAYDATFNANGGKFADETTSKAVPTLFGSTPVAPADPAQQGYVFAGWTPALNVMDTVGGETYTATWTPATNTPYVINTYTMGVDGEYGAADVQNLTGTTNAPVDATPASVDEGFELNATASNLTGTIAADGLTVLNVYIDRSTFTVTTTVDEADTEYNFLFGAEITGIPDPVKTGYTFDDWNPALPATMPANDIATEAVFNPNAVSYTINYYDMAIGGANTEITRTDATKTATADTEITITPVAPVEGFTLNAAASNLTATVEADGSTVFSVYYTRNQYEFSVDNANGAANPEAASYYYGEAVEAPAEPTRTGYTFTEWSGEVPATMPANDVAITAGWSVNKHNVVYYVDNAQYQTVLNQDYNSVLATIAAPERTGYEFSGWTSEDVTIEANEFTVPDGNVRIDGTFTAKSYNVTFNAGAGTFGSSGLTTLVVPVDFDSTIAVPEQPVRPGYTFGGWFDANSDEVELPVTMTTADDITLTAHWSAATLSYTLNTYTMNIGGLTYAEKTESIAAVTDATINLAGTAAVTAPEGFTFDATSSTITGVNNGSLTLNVYFTRNQYTFSVDNANGEANPSDATYYFGEDVTAPAEPTRTGYTFTEWTPDVPATMPADDVEVVAGWEINSRTITYFVDGVQNGSVETYTFGTPITIRGPVAKTGYTWAGWDGADDFPATMPDENITLNAVYTINSYNVSFSVDGTVIEGPTLTEFNSPIVVPSPEPTKEDWTFGGWWTDAVGGTMMPINMPAGDVTYYAHWNPMDAIPYTIEIYLQQLDGTFSADPTVSVQLTGTTGQNVSMTPVPYTGFTLDADRSVLSGTISSGNFALKAYYNRNSATVTFMDIDGAGAQSVETYYYGEPIVVPAIADVTGKVFTGWNAEIPTIMGATALTFTAQWVDTEYTVTYVVNGVTNTATFAYGEEISLDAPQIPGYTFAGWEPSLPETMPDHNLAVTAILTGASYTATFLDAFGNTWDEFTVNYGMPIPLPEHNPTWSTAARRFVRWNLVDGATMPGYSIQITPVFEDVEITLIAKAGSTTVIEMNDEANTTNIIYGIPANYNLTGEDLLNEYIDYTGYGRIEITPAATNLGVDVFGTGTKVELYDAGSNTLLETYYIVIFGDVNGDTRVDVADSTEVTREAGYVSNWSRPDNSEYMYCKLRAANLNGGGITSTDASRIKYIANYMATVDQTTGIYTAY